MSQAENNERPGPGKYHIILDIGMGILYLGLSAYVLITRHFGNFELTGALAYSMVALLVVYGGFRIYRGVVAYRRQKNEISRL